MIVIGPQRRRPQVVLQRQAWRQALGYWRRLFYCFRCDVVFVPGHGQFAQRTEMYDFVYRLGSAFSQGAADLGTCLLDLEDLPAGFVIAWCADYSTRMVALDSDDPVATQQLLQQQGRLSSPIVSYLKEPSLRTPFSGEVGVTDQLIEYRTVGHAQQRVVPLSNEACARGYERLQMHQLGDQSVALRKTAGNTVAFRMIVRCGRFVALIDCWGKRRRMSESHAFRFAKAAADRLAMVRATARPYQRDFDDIFGNARFSSGGIRVGSSNL